MQPFTSLSGIAAPLEEANVDTNQICPTRFNQVPRGERFARILFHDRRFDAKETEKRDFVLNAPPYDHAVILVAGRNFGCGSSRETAVYGLLTFGIRAVIAESFGDIFKNNAFKNGLLPIELSEQDVTSIFGYLKEEPGGVVTVDLPTQTVAAGRKRFRFNIEPLNKKRLLLGLDEVACTRAYQAQIDAFEAQHLKTHFWINTRPNTP